MAMSTLTRSLIYIFLKLMGSFFKLMGSAVSSSTYLIPSTNFSHIGLQMGAFYSKKKRLQMATTSSSLLSLVHILFVYCCTGA